MPHLRFTRDRRGYENTYLVHRHRPAQGDRSPSILYWFRTPPDIRVGRTALDEDAIRALEAAHPGIHFDWERILEATPDQPAPGGRPGRETFSGAPPQTSGRRVRRERHRPAREGELRRREPASRRPGSARGREGSAGDSAREAGTTASARDPMPNDVMDLSVSADSGRPLPDDASGAPEDGS